MFNIDPTRLHADALLADASAARTVAEQAEVRILQDAAHWADLNAVLDRPGPALPGCERLVCFGGDGTPVVAEFCAGEFGAVLGMSDHSGRKLIGAALDLRHRLPNLWKRVQSGEVKPWVGRQVAEATQHLSVQTAAVVDRRVAPFAGRLSWGRIEAIVQAAWMEADPQAAAEADAESESELGVWVNPSTEHGTKSVFMQLEAPDAIRFDATVERTADGLGLLGDDRAKDTRRAAAVGVLADPQRALDLFDQVADVAGVQLETPRKRSSRRVDTRPPVTLYVHLSQDALECGMGVARVEGVGPVTANRVKTWLGHTNVTVKPVIDLNNQTPVDAYEVPDRIREAVHLRSPVDCFPYATSTARTGDIDHTIPYRHPDTGGPPGQTNLDNLAPFTRRHHRIKTHAAGWQVRQVFNGAFVWRSPHGYHFLVDHTGTRPAHRAA